jgi:valyl-tRNA synthetase
MSTTSADSTTGTDTKYDIENKENGIIGKYEPQLFESQIYKWWEDAGCFKPDSKQSKDEAKANGREPYVLPMPPPNVTGRLHMGHAIFVALQDVLARFHRMRGRPVLWLPGECIIYI